uniref:Uncharacterized protein n=1 Tax=Schistosoma mansoni TaxID=6183 RepID=A0A5K4FCE4_SCHMA
MVYLISASRKSKFIQIKVSFFVLFWIKKKFAVPLYCNNEYGILILALHSTRYCLSMSCSSNLVSMSFTTRLCGES